MAQKGWVFYTDGDGQYDPGAIPKALGKAREGYDLVLGSRFIDPRQPLQDHMSWARYLANIGLSAIERFVLNLPLSEFHTGFRVYSKNLAETVALDNTSNDFLFGFEIIADREITQHFNKSSVLLITDRLNIRGSKTLLG